MSQADNLRICDCSNLISEFIQISDSHYAGFVYSSTEPLRRFVIEITIDSVSIATVIADDYDLRLYNAGIGDGCYRFDFDIDSALLKSNSLVEARVANTSIYIANAVSPGALANSPEYSSEESKGVGTIDAIKTGHIISKRRGKISWQGGLILSGCTTYTTPSGIDYLGEQQKIYVQDKSGKSVTEKVIVPWQGIDSISQIRRSETSFSITLPLALADGLPHKLSITFADGSHLDGSPLSIFVPLLQVADLRPVNLLECPSLTTEHYTEFLPMSVPLRSGYNAWKPEHRKATHLIVDELYNSRGIGVLIIGGGEDELKETLDSLRATSHTNWVAVNVPADPESHRFMASDLQMALDQIRTSLGEEVGERTPIIVCRGGTSIHSNALCVLAHKIECDHQVNIVYTDYDIACVGESANELYPIFLSAPDYERWLEQAYVSNFFAGPIGQFRNVMSKQVTSIERLSFTLIDEAAPFIDTVVAHMPVVLASCKNFVISSKSPCLIEDAAISHLKIRGFDNARACPRMGSLKNIRRHDGLKRSSVTIILEDASISSERVKWFIENWKWDELDVEILTDDGSWVSSISKFDYQSNSFDITEAAPQNCTSHNAIVSRAQNLNNLIRRSKFDIIAVIEKNVVPRSLSWLSEAVDRLFDLNVGAVSPVLRYEDGTVREAGILFGANFVPSRGLAGSAINDIGYNGILETAHERSSLTCTCCVLKKSLWLLCGEFDQICLPNFYFDIDLFFRFREKRQCLIVQPCDEIVWLASEFGQNKIGREDARLRELAEIRSRWSYFMHNDPSFNPNLGLPDPYHTLAWPVRSVFWRGGSIK